MPKFKQLTATDFTRGRSSTSGRCVNQDGEIAHCSGIVNAETKGTQAACVLAGGTWTNHTKATCNAKVVAAALLTELQIEQGIDIYYAWEGDGFLRSVDRIESIDLNKVQSWEVSKSPVTRDTLITTHTSVVTDNGKYNIKRTLEQWMEIMAIEVK